MFKNCYIVYCPKNLLYFTKNGNFNGEESPFLFQTKEIAEEFIARMFTCTTSRQLFTRQEAKVGQVRLCLRSP